MGGECMLSTIPSSIVGSAPLAPVIAHAEAGDGVVHLTVVISPAVAGALPLQMLRVATPQGAIVPDYPLDAMLQPTDAPLVKTATVWKPE